MLKFHLDTDSGGDIDDRCALTMVLNWPGAAPPALAASFSLTRLVLRRVPRLKRGP